MSRLGKILSSIVTRQETLESKAIPKELTISGTTGSSGNLELTTLPSTATAVIPESVTGGSYFAIPFKSGSSWYLKVLAWNLTTYTVAASKPVTAKVLYWET